MKDRLLDSTIDGISDGSKDENSGGITDFALPHDIPEFSIEEHVVESFREVRKHAKRLENIVTSIEKFSLILADEKHIKDVSWTRKITNLMMSSISNF